MTIRRSDGSLGVAGRSARAMSPGDWQTAMESFAHQELFLGALQDPALLRRVRAALV